MQPWLQLTVVTSLTVARHPKSWVQLPAVVPPGCPPPLAQSGAAGCHRAHPRGCLPHACPRSRCHPAGSSVLKSKSLVQKDSAGSQLCWARGTNPVLQIKDGSCHVLGWKQCPTPFPAPTMAIPAASTPVSMFVSSDPQILVLLLLRGRAQFLLATSLPLLQHQGSAAHPPLLLDPPHPHFCLCLREPLSSSLI